MAVFLYFTFNLFTFASC